MFISPFFLCVINLIPFIFIIIYFDSQSPDLWLQLAFNGSFPNQRTSNRKDNYYYLPSGF